MTHGDVSVESQGFSSSPSRMLSGYQIVYADAEQDGGDLVDCSLKLGEREYHQPEGYPIIGERFPDHVSITMRSKYRGGNFPMAGLNPGNPVRTKPWNPSDVYGKVDMLISPARVCRNGDDIVTMELQERVLLTCPLGGYSDKPCVLLDACPAGEYLPFCAVVAENDTYALCAPVPTNYLTMGSVGEKPQCH